MPPSPTEPRATPADTARQSEDERNRRRRSRNLAMLGALLAFAGLIYAVTILKMKLA